MCTVKLDMDGEVWGGMRMVGEFTFDVTFVELHESMGVSQNSWIWILILSSPVLNPLVPGADTKILTEY